MNEELIKRLICRTAELAIGPSTVRNQGAVGVVRSARSGLRNVDLPAFKRADRASYSELLDKETQSLRRRLPPTARHWGTARKCLNIFLRDVLYCRYLCDHFSFHKFQAQLEVPLDGHVAGALLKDAEGTELPRWRTIKSLTPQQSEQYQAVARRIAMRKDTHAVHLDLLYWRAFRAV